MARIKAIFEVAVSGLRAGESTRRNNAIDGRKSNHVFINCPSDAGHRPIFNAIVFTISHLGFVARCSLEEDDAAEFRV